MEASLLEQALDEGNISQTLHEGSTNKPLVTELQRLLFELGFKKELQFDNYEADGIYGPATVNSVTAFAAKNDVSSNGRSVSNVLAKLIQQRHSFLPEMYLLWEIHQGDLRTKNIFPGAPV